jgi:hypothetical protein
MTTFKPFPDASARSHLLFDHIASPFAHWRRARSDRRSTRDLGRALEDLDERTLRDLGFDLLIAHTMHAGPAMPYDLVRSVRSPCYRTR